MHGYDHPPAPAAWPAPTDTSPYAPPYERVATADAGAPGHPAQAFAPLSHRRAGGSVRSPSAGPPPPHAAAGWYDAGAAAGGYSTPFPSGFPAPPGAPAASTSPTAVTGLALGAGALAVLGLASGLVSAAIAVVGLLVSAAALLLARAPRRAGRGVAIAGLTTSGVAAALAGIVFLFSWTGAGAALGAWLGGDVFLPVVALRPGEPGTVGEYTVTVDEIRLGPGAAVTADQRDLSAGGAYVEAVVTVTYDGAGVGFVEEDLLVSYAGSDDDWLYDEWSCSGTTESPVWEVGALREGETATFVACMDVPADVVHESAVIVEDLAAEDFTAELWGER